MAKLTHFTKQAQSFLIAPMANTPKHQLAVNDVAAFWLWQVFNAVRVIEAQLENSEEKIASILSQNGDVEQVEQSETEWAILGQELGYQKSLAELNAMQPSKIAAALKQYPDLLKKVNQLTSSVWDKAALAKALFLKNQEQLAMRKKHQRVLVKWKNANWRLSNIDVAIELSTISGKNLTIAQVSQQRVTHDNTIDWAKVDYTYSDDLLAEKYNVSLDYVANHREQYGKGIVVAHLREFKGYNDFQFEEQHVLNLNAILDNFPYAVIVPCVSWYLEMANALVQNMVLPLDSTQEADFISFLRSQNITPQSLAEDAEGLFNHLLDKFRVVYGDTLQGEEAIAKWNKAIGKVKFAYAYNYVLKQRCINALSDCFVPTYPIGYKAAIKPTKERKRRVVVKDIDVFLDWDKSNEELAQEWNVSVGTIYLHRKKITGEADCANAKKKATELSQEEIDKIDWNKTSQNIADEKGVSLTTVLKWRKEHNKPTPRSRSKNQDFDWASVDWRLSNAKLMEELGFSMSYISNKRQKFAPERYKGKVRSENAESVK